MDQNQEIFEKLLEDSAFVGLVKEFNMKRIYNQLNKQKRM